MHSQNLHAVLDFKYPEIGLIFKIALLGIIDCQRLSAVRATDSLGFSLIDKGVSAVSADAFAMGSSERNMVDAFVHSPIYLLLGDVGELLIGNYNRFLKGCSCFHLLKNQRVRVLPGSAV